MQLGKHDPGSVGRSRSVRGFTLVELMVTVAVLAVILAIGVPSFTGIMHRNRLTASANELVAALQTAKMEAIRRNSRVVICPTANGTSCSGGSDWSRVIVFADLNGNSIVNTDDTLIQDVTVNNTGTGITVPGGTTPIRYGADGRARIGTATTGTISVVSSRLSTDNTRRVQLAGSRVNVCNPTGNSTCT